LDRRAVYLGKYNSPESWQRYRQLVSEYGTPAKRRLPVLESDQPITVAELVERFLIDAVEQYGQSNEYLSTLKNAVAPLLELYASTAVKDFGPKSLKAVRAHRISQGHKRCRASAKKPAAQWRPIARVYINKLVRVIVSVFQWGVSEELVPEGVWIALSAVKGLRKGKSNLLRECKPVKPVPDDHVQAVLKEVSPEIAAMIRLQLATAMRPDEVTAIRPCDLDRTDDAWTYTLGDRHQGGIGHKTDYLDDESDKTIYLGPKAQAIIRPFLSNCPPTEFLFSPARAVARRYPNGNRGLKATARYNDDSYCRAVKRACLRAGVPIWTPNRLRHSAGTEVRNTCGIEAAQVALHHKSITTTERYAERQDHRKREVALRTG
jgi:integrase